MFTIDHIARQVRFGSDPVTRAAEVARQSVRRCPALRQTGRPRSENARLTCTPAAAPLARTSATSLALRMPPTATTAGPSDTAVIRTCRRERRFGLRRPAAGPSAGRKRRRGGEGYTPLVRLIRPVRPAEPELERERTRRGSPARAAATARSAASTSGSLAGASSGAQARAEQVEVRQSSPPQAP